MGVEGMMLARSSSADRENQTDRVQIVNEVDKTVSLLHKSKLYSQITICYIY